MYKLLNKLGVKPGNHNLVLTMYFAFFVSGINTVLIGAILPYIREAYQLDYAQSGMVLSINQVGNFAALILSGILPVAIGMKRSAVLMGCGLAIGLLLTTVGVNPMVLMIAFLLIGLARGSWSNVCNTAIGFSFTEKTGPLNILHAIYAVGALLSPLIVLIPIEMFGSDWRVAPLIVAALGVIAVISTGLSNLPTKTVVEKKEKNAAEREILRTRQFWMVTMILFFYLGTEASVIGWFVSYFKDAGILSGVAATLTPTIQWSMVMVGRLFIAAISGRFHREKAIVLMGVGYAVSFLAMLMFQTATVSIICLLLIGFSMAGIYPTVFSTLKDMSSPMANGLCMGIATLGSVITPTLVGVVAEAKGLLGGVAVILGACLIMLALMVLNMILSRAPAKTPSI